MRSTPRLPTVSITASAARRRATAGRLHAAATRVGVALLVAAASLQPALAQHRAPQPRTPPAEARQYDFLLGEWQLAVEVPPASLAARIHGMPKLVGTWKAWRALDGWGVTDELRITDEAGNPVSLSHNVRYYDAKQRRWAISALDVYRGVFSSPAAEWRGGQMHLTSRGTSPDGRAYLNRTRMFDITPDGFRLQQDRSFDGGKRWEEGALEITARRSAAAARR